jgi:phosphate transport system permease protein
MNERMFNTNKLKKVKASKNILFYGIIGIMAAITLAALIVIIGYILVNGITHINLEFLTQEPRRMGISEETNSTPIPASLTQ